MKSISFLMNFGAQKLQLLAHEHAIGCMIIDHQNVQRSEGWLPTRTSVSCHRSLGAFSEGAHQSEQSLEHFASGVCAQQ
jgi:hypothetical protein